MQSASWLSSDFPVNNFITGLLSSPKSCFITDCSPGDGCCCVTNRGKLSWWPKSRNGGEDGKGPEWSSILHYSSECCLLGNEHFLPADQAPEEILGNQSWRFCSLAEVTPLQLVILSLSKLGVECEENWAKSSSCTEHLGPGEPAVDRQLFVIFPSASTEVCFLSLFT